MASRVFVGLHARRTIMGMDRRLFAVFMGVTLYVLVFAPLGWPARIAVALAAAMVFIWLRAQNKREPDLLPIYVRYAKQADYYEPWPDYKPKRNWRPVGFGDVEVLK